MINDREYKNEITKWIIKGRRVTKQLTGVDEVTKFIKNRNLYYINPHYQVNGFVGTM